MSRPVSSGSGSTHDNPTTDRRLVTLASFVIPVALVIGLFVLLLSLRDSAEAAVAGVAGLLPVGFAFAAGMVASVNPCGFFMLPAYLSYHLGSGDAGFHATSPVRRAFRAIRLGVVATAGFVVPLVLAGVL